MDLPILNQFALDVKQKICIEEASVPFAIPSEK